MQNKPKDIPYCDVRQNKIKTAKPIVNSESLELFTHWISERYKVHLKKEANEPRPWTEDWILDEYRFTNVRREQDRQTKYLIDNIVNNAKLKLEEKIVNIIMFRCWNLWSTMKDFGGPWKISKLNDDKTISRAEAYVNKHPEQKYFTSAFMTSGMNRYVKVIYNCDSTVLSIFYLGRDVVDKKIPEKILKAKDPREVCDIIETLPGLAGFLSYQMFVDMTYIPEFPFSENEFTIAGPGCKKGLKALFYDANGLNAEELVFWLRDNLSHIAPGFNPMILMTDLPEEERFLSVMSLENCLCEFSKYYRAYTDYGRPRQRYTPYTGDDE